MMSSIKRSIERVLAEGDDKRDAASNQIEFGSCYRPFRKVFSLFYLLYEVEPRLLPNKIVYHHDKVESQTVREGEAITLRRLRATTMEVQKKGAENRRRRSTNEIWNWSRSELYLLLNGLLFNQCCTDVQ